MNKTTYVLIGLWALVLTGCSSMQFKQAEDIISMEVSARAVGVYTVQTLKDGKVLFSESWKCSLNDESKLNCKKVQ